MDQLGGAVVHRDEGTQRDVGLDLKVSSAFLSGSASWIITNFSVGVPYSESVMIVAADAISAPDSGSSG